MHRLERAGLVSLRREPPDRRILHVQLTATGTALEAAAAQAQHTVACDTRLTPLALDALGDDLHALVDQMTMSATTESAPIEGAAS